MVNTVGDATHGPFVQLKNTSGTLVLKVYELMIGVSIASGTSRIRARRTSSPLTLAGTTTTATAFRRDERDATAIAGVLAGCTAIASVFTEATSFWFDRINADSATTYEELVLLRPLSFPIIVKPGSAIEVVNPDASATNALRVYACWDELAS